MAIGTLSQSIEITDVTDVAVSAVAHDDVLGDYYRTITIFGSPDEGGATIPTTFLLRIRAPTADPLKISVPADEF
jgi:hypothetical protein